MVHIKLYRSNSHNNCVISMLKSFTIWSFFITQSNLVQSFKNFDLVEVAGSGESARTHQECYPEFQLFDQKYLRGVNKPFYTTKSNNVTLDRCMELCCNQPPETCRSFSYFLDLNVCYLMNVTQYDNFAILQPAVSFKHYHRSRPLSSIQLATTEAHITANQISNVKPNTNPAAIVTPNTATVTTRETPVTTLTRLLEPNGKAPTSKAPQGSKHDAPQRPEKTFNISLPENEHESATGNSGDLLTSESGPIRPSTILTTITTSRVTSELSTVMSSTVFAPPATTATPAAVSNKTSLASTANDSYSAIPAATRTKTASDTYDVVLCSNHYCQNGGTCVMEVDIKSNKKFTKCNCPHGYEGADCERNVAKKGSLPSYIIIVAILGSLFLLLFGAVLVLYVIYRRRTGKYRVKKRREDWRKTAASPNVKEGNPQQQDEEAHCVQEQGSTSGASTVGSVTSTATRSTNATL